MTTPEQDLFNTIEVIRSKKFPDLPAELVKQIILVERDFTENRQEAYRRVARIIDQHLERPVEGEG